VSDDIGACRPLALCVLGRGERAHAGEDLRAPRGTTIRATEAGTVVHVSRDWYKGSGVLLLQTDTGPVFAFGEIEPDSERTWGIAEGTRVERGDSIATVGRHNQLHFEAYIEGTTRTARWPLGGPPPASLLDPVPYLRLAAET